MTDITEKQTMEMFMQGASKAKSAARQLAHLNQTQAWTKVRSNLAQIQKTAQKLYDSKPQTRIQTLALAAKIQGDTVH